MTHVLRFAFGNGLINQEEANMTVLVTGGAGFIGSHTAVELLNEGYDVVVIDNLCNANAEAIRRVEKITGKKIFFYENDVRDRAALELIFTAHDIGSVIHFAGLKAVGESVRKPIEYYENNLGSTLVLVDVMRKFGVKNIVFSSSATVYGDPAELPLRETTKLNPTTNPYGATKVMQERILEDLYASDSEWNVTLLRYFNPVGAHESGLIGEDPKGIPNNLMPYVAQVASGKLREIGVFGNDYPTKDGTGVRDYIHVVDLAKGHVAALRSGHKSGVHVYNLGTGIGYSVLDMIAAFSKACGKQLPYTVKPRRAGDIAACYASSEKAERELGWKAQFDLEKMCADQWNWQKNNPDGYGS